MMVDSTTTCSMPDTDQATIFVSIASYRDNQCQYTVQNLFEKSARPERIVVGICFQVAAEDEDNFVLDLSRWAHQIRTYFIRHHEAKGPCYARAIIQQKLFQDEDYFFQIDSHMRFAQDWDVLCLEQLSRCDSPKPVLTAYASSYTLPKDYAPGQPDGASLAVGTAVTIICADTFGDRTGDDPFLRLKSRTCRSDFGHMPPPALFWTARFAFSRGEVVRDVSYDVHLEYLFFGEEISMSARLWTSGWDLFNPTRNIAYHLGSRAHRPWFREVQTSPRQVQRETEAKLRVCGLLGHSGLEGSSERPVEPEAPYGLGTARSLAEYEKFAGVSFKDEVVHERAKHGGLPSDLFAPLWAEEERDKVMQANQMQDPTTWAGKGNAHALQRQFPDMAASMKAPAFGMAPAKKNGRNSEVERVREVTHMRIDALRARLPNCDGEETVATEIEISRSFTTLGQIASSEDDRVRAEKAYTQALHHVQLALEGPLGDEPMTRASALCAKALATNGLRRFDKAKPLLKDAFCLVIKALSSQLCRLEPTEQLGLDVLDAVHSAHEKTDDRTGLEGYVQHVETFLTNLRKAAQEGPPVAVPVLGALQPPREGGELSVRARLLERACLVCIATGREQGFAVARRVFTDFRIARESPNLLKLLGILQTSGHLL